MNKKYMVNKKESRPVSQRLTKKLICIVCRKNSADINHHVSYKDDLTVPVCYSCHRKIHNDKDNDLYPIDGNNETRINYHKARGRQLFTFRCEPELMQDFDNINPSWSRSFKIRLAITNYIKFTHKRRFYNSKGHDK